MRIMALAKRIIKQIVRDKRSMGLLFGAPLIVLWLMSIVFTASETKSTIDLVNIPPQLATKLADTDADVHEVTAQEAKQRLRDGKTDGYVTFANNSLQIKLEGSDPVSNKAVLAALQKAAADMSPSRDFIRVSYLHGGSKLDLLDYFAPVLMGFFIFFFVFLISGVSFLRERTGGTLERVLATPVRRHEVVLGYFLGFGLFALLQTSLVQWFALKILGIHSLGNFWQVLVVNSLLAAVALSLGTLLSAFARNEFQMVQFIPLVIVPQIFFSGLFDLRGMPDWLIILSQALPLTNAAEALRGMMIRGESITEQLVPLLVLAGFSLLFLVLNVLVLKRYRKV